MRRKRDKRREVTNVTIVEHEENYDLIAITEMGNEACIGSMSSHNFSDWMEKREAKRIYKSTVDEAVNTKGAKIVYKGPPLRG